MRGSTAIRRNTVCCALYVRLPDEEIERCKAALDSWEVIPD